MRLKYIMTNIGIIFCIISIFAVQAVAADPSMADPTTGRISGYKVNDANGNGNWDKKETGIQGWKISLVGYIDQDTGYGHTTKVINRQVNTDKNGFYEFKNLPKGTYQITEEFNSLYRPTTSFIINMKLKSGQNSANNNFLNQPIKPPSITVTYPNGGENWKQGSGQSITWKSTEISSNENVVIQILKGNTVKAEWTKPNSGTLSLTVTSAFPVGNDYKVKITGTGSHSAISDMSDNYFTISPAPSITVSFPNGGENWKQGSSQSITWKSVNIPNNENVVIQILKGNTVKAQWTKPNSGTLSLTVTSAFPVGNDYKVKITGTGSNSGISDISDGYFRIYK